MTVSQLPAQEAELITLWVSQHVPALVAALANVRHPGTGSQQP